MSPARPDLSRISTEQRNPRTADIDTMSTLEMVTAINAEDALVAPAVATQLPAIANAVDAIVEGMRHGGRLIYIGAGTSGRLGVLDASECPPTFNAPPGLVVGLIAGGDHALRHAVEHVEDQPDAGKAALHDIGLREHDTVVGIAASGRTPFVLGGIAYAKDVGATTVGICNSEDAALSAAVDIPIAVIVGPEVITGSTRMKSGTAQKLVCNMLSTGAMVRMGKTFGNLMVDVQPTNEKLKMRSIRIVRDATGVSDSEAETALHRADGEVKTAIVALLLGVSDAEAREALSRTEGRVREAISEGSSK